MPEIRVPAPAALARLCIYGIATYIAVDVLLAFLRPGYSLLHNAESDYGRGPWFWVMDANFLLRAALTMALVVALAQQTRHDRRLRDGLGFLVVWAVCSGLLAFFADDLEGQRVHGSGTVHFWLAVVAFACLVGGTAVLSIRLRAHVAWAPRTELLMWFTPAGFLALVALENTAGHPARLGGLAERVVLGVEFLWMVIVAAWIVQLERRAAD